MMGLTVTDIDRFNGPDFVLTRTGGPGNPPQLEVYLNDGDARFGLAASRTCYGSPTRTEPMTRYGCGSRRRHQPG